MGFYEFLSISFDFLDKLNPFLTILLLVIVVRRLSPQKRITIKDLTDQKRSENIHEFGSESDFRFASIPDHQFESIAKDLHALNQQQAKSMKAEFLANLNVRFEEVKNHKRALSNYYRALSNGLLELLLCVPLRYRKAAMNSLENLNLPYLSDFVEEFSKYQNIMSIPAPTENPVIALYQAKQLGYNIEVPDKSVQLFEVICSDQKKEKTPSENSN